MKESIHDLELQRSQLLERMVQLGDLRPGSITPIRGRCGKPTCHCHRPNDPGHGPNFRLTRKVEGKTVSETFPTAAGQKKAEREVAEFHRFRELCQDFVALNERICRLRPVEEPEASRQEKKRRKPSTGKSGGRSTRS